ncbi:MAG: SPOR domain-containing protein [Proteobacteria bacterium]|nr:SPOR domain-containing protein [Pseudomonadota bacterium]
MGLLNIFKRKADAAAPAAIPEAAGDVARARTRARRRLIGAVVLVAVGVVGFPLVFETQPRPIPLDIPIEIPRKDAVPPLAIPPARVALNGASGATAIPEPEVPATADTRTEPSAADAAPAGSQPDGDKPVAVEKPAAEKPAAKPVDKPADKLAERVAAKPADAPAERPRGAANDDGARAAALLEGKDAPKPAAAADASRFVVQIGAYAEASAAQETRQKVEKLGLKTYTQVAETPNGNRIRVRLGPFASRDDADKALAKAKSAGLSGVILTL